jgi:hypothetical protein
MKPTYVPSNDLKKLVYDDDSSSVVAGWVCRQSKKKEREKRERENTAQGPNPRISTLQCLRPSYHISLNKASLVIE